MPKKSSKNVKEKTADKPVDLGIFKFVTPEDIDGMIKAHMDRVRETHQCPWDKDTLLLRNSVILQYICEQGLSNRRTAEQISARWNISMDAAIDWVKSALETLAAHTTENIEDLRKKHIERLENMMEQALNDGAKDAALKCSDQIAKTLGLYSERKDINVKGETTITFEFS